MSPLSPPVAPPLGAGGWQEGAGGWQEDLTTRLSPRHH